MPGPDPAARPSDAAAAETAHRRAVVLSEIAAGGLPAFALALIHARNGDETVARMTASELLRAVPGVGFLTSHDLLCRAGIPESGRVGELLPDQRVALVEAVCWLSRTTTVRF